jgi:quinol monooxygenase YgiN
MEARKFIVGRIRLRPGQSAAFMDYARRYMVLSRQDDGCLYFDMMPSAEDEDEIIFVECFRDEAAHEAHTKTAHFAEGGEVLQRMAQGVRVDNIFAREVKTDEVSLS